MHFLKFPDEATAKQVLAAYTTDKYETVYEPTGTFHTEYQYQYDNAAGETVVFNYWHDDPVETIATDVLDDGVTNVEYLGPVQVPDVHPVQKLIASGDWITASHTHALDVIGTIYKPTGVMLTDSEGNQYPETAPIPGFHVNMVGEIPAEIEAYCLIPDNPVRLFAS